MLCNGMDQLSDHGRKCFYLQQQDHPCVSQGYIDYLKVFYYLCGGSPLLGYTILLLWLIILFYLLGTTASDYFCSSLQSLSSILGLSPAIAGVTLLSLDNGAPDVFAAIVSFAGPRGASDTAAVGLSGVLGASLFVSTVVVGIISVLITSENPVVDRAEFVRDACFLLATQAVLGVVLLVGRINVWGAAGFASMYVLYLVVVSVTHCRKPRETGLESPLLLQSVQVDDGSEPQLVETEESNRHCRLHSEQLFDFLELPLNLPRRMTIPMVDEDRWSKPYAVASASLAPLLLAFIWNAHLPYQPPTQSLEIYLFAGLVGMALGIVAVETTEPSRPPKSCLLPWLAGGFAMSVLWSYIAAGELVALLVSLGRILGINPSVLAFTVLAWGNSVGDLIANVAMAVGRGDRGAQIAVSGCYAGPLFNTLVGLGLSIAISARKARPGPLVISTDRSTFQVLGFLVGGVLWALVVLPRRAMKLDKVLGLGLLTIYICLLSLRLTYSLLWHSTAS